MKKLLMSFAVMLMLPIAIVLTACGGGNGGDGEQNYTGQAFLGTYVQHFGSVTLNADASGVLGFPGGSDNFTYTVDGNTVTMKFAANGAILQGDQTGTFASNFTTLTVDVGIPATFVKVDYTGLDFVDTYEGEHAGGTILRTLVLSANGLATYSAEEVGSGDPVFESLYTYIVTGNDITIFTPVTGTWTGVFTNNFDDLTITTLGAEIHELTRKTTSTPEPTKMPVGLYVFESFTNNGVPVTEGSAFDWASGITINVGANTVTIADPTTFANVGEFAYRIVGDVVELNISSSWVNEGGVLGQGETITFEAGKIIATMTDGTVATFHLPT